jgi:hypothetical protein
VVAGIEYVRDDAHHRISVTVRGRPTRLAIESVLEQQVLEGAWGYGTLWDVREMDEPIPWADVELLARRVSDFTAQLGRRGPVAVVARELRVIGTAHMYAYRAAPARLLVRTFHDVADAEQWLDQVVRIDSQSAAHPAGAGASR